MPEIAEITVNGQPKKVNFEINGEIYTLGGGKEPVIEPLTVTRNGDYRPPTGTDGYAPVTVDIPSDCKPEQEKTLRVTDNGTFSIKPDGGKVLSGATVNVDVPKQKSEQTKEVSITANGDTTITPDSGKVLASVTVSVNIPQKEYSHWEGGSF